MILVLGGTTEGRLAVKVLDESGKPYFYSTRGDSQQVSCRHGERVSGGMDAEKMEAFCRAHSVRLLVDAAHPFAVRLHETVEQVSRSLQLPVVRFERIYPPRTDEVIWCADYQEAVRRLKEDGITRLLALTGVQTIGKLRDFWGRTIPSSRLVGSVSWIGRNPSHWPCGRVSMRIGWSFTMKAHRKRNFWSS